jgi:hypothetical protein
MPHLATYVALADHCESILAESFRTVAEGHRESPDLYHMCHTLAQMNVEHRELLGPVRARYGEQSSRDGLEEPERLRPEGLAGARAGEVGLLRDLQDLHALATLTQTTWTVIGQAGQGLRDRELLDITSSASKDVARQLTWLNTRMKQVAPQALIV